MNYKEQLAILYKMRFMENKGDDIEKFEEMLNELSFHAGNEVIPELCKIFEDDVAEPSADDYVIETIFYIASRNGLEDGLIQLVSGIPNMAPQAEFWADRIHRTLLNSEELIFPYIKALQQVDEYTKQIVKDILCNIKSEMPDLYTEKIDFMLNHLAINEVN
ncbi:Immunity protein 30 [Bacillus sp. 491mf]|uniref:Imm30 family immunity protein n=1 Tax=Bacillus TaxID=1386 RepID=UPI00054E80E6|nr:MULTISPECIES: Imm30 family immunity protein [unclassified Bacillus (in: firmicutes)]SFC43052.1 Immunity protein 30 [Bacillus sp. 491mf]